MRFTNYHVNIDKIYLLQRMYWLNDFSIPRTILHNSLPILSEYYSNVRVKLHEFRPFGNMSVLIKSTITVLNILIFLIKLHIIKCLSTVHDYVYIVSKHIILDTYNYNVNKLKQLFKNGFRLFCSFLYVYYRQAIS